MNPKSILIAGAVILSTVASAFAQAPYTWRPYSPNIHFDFRDVPGFQTAAPTRDTVPRGCNVHGSRSSGWWSFYWGSAVNPLLSNGQHGANNSRVVRNEIIDPMLERMNDEFAYFRDVMGWPACRRNRQGFRSVIHLYGSGLGCVGGGRDSMAQGGWQSGDGFSPVVLLSWRPVLAFHPASYSAAGFNDRAGQTGGVVHEGIHVLLASMTDPSGNPVERNVPGWFHEGGNTWLQKQADAQRNNRFGTWAMLDGTQFIAPFMPIECYSGWLQDGSFGGPNAEGVNLWRDAQGNVTTTRTNQQVCTWRTWLGGTQYGNGFPSFMGEWLGLGSIPWIWVNSTNRNDRVLGTIAKGLGEEQTRRLIYEYRAKQAVLDLRRWTEGARAHIVSYFGRNLGPEGNTNGGNWFPNLPAWWSTPYAITTASTSGGVTTLTPDPLTLPGWSGANQIPLLIPPGVNEVVVDFMPDTANMVLQLAYRDSGGRAVYSAPLTNVRAGQTGTVRLRLDTAPSMGPSSGTGSVTGNARRVVIAVISNTDYLYRNDQTRFAKYKYRIAVRDGVTPANVRTAWFNTPNMQISSEYQPEQTSAVKTAGQMAVQNAAFNVAASKPGCIRVSYSVAAPSNITFDIYNTTGARVKSVPAGYKRAGEYNEELDLRRMGLSSGKYIVRLRGAPGGMAKSVAFIK